MWTQNWFLGFHSVGMDFFREKTSKPYSIHHFPKKRLYSFLSSNVLFSENWLRPAPPPKKFFVSYFGEYWFFFSKKIVKFLQKRLYWFLSPDAPFSSKQSCPATNSFLQFCQCKLKNILEILLPESILIRKKILWRINFVIIKFLLNALLFEKLWNECKNPSFLHKITCIMSDHAGAVAKFHIHSLEL